MLTYCAVRGANRKGRGRRMDDDVVRGLMCRPEAAGGALGWLRAVVSPLQVARSAGRLARGARSVRSRNGHARIVPGQVEVFEQLRQLGVR